MPAYDLFGWRPCRLRITMTIRITIKKCHQIELLRSAGTHRRIATGVSYQLANKYVTFFVAMPVETRYSHRWLPANHDPAYGGCEDGFSPICNP